MPLLNNILEVNTNWLFESVFAGHPIARFMSLLSEITVDDKQHRYRGLTHLGIKVDRK